MGEKEEIMAKLVAAKAEKIAAFVADLRARRQEVAGTAVERKEERRQPRFKKGSYLTVGQVEDEKYQTDQDIK